MDEELISLEQFTINTMASLILIRKLLDRYIRYYERGAE